MAARLHPPVDPLPPLLVESLSAWQSRRCVPRLTYANSSRRGLFRDARSWNNYSLYAAQDRCLCLCVCVCVYAYVCMHECACVFAPVRLSASVPPSFCFHFFPTPRVLFYLCLVKIPYILGRGLIHLVGSLRYLFADFGGIEWIAKDGKKRLSGKR